MCGIAGIVHIDGSGVLKKDLDVLTDALSHRGPDGRGVFIDRNVGLGHRRLSIIDLTDASAQPMKNADESVVLSFNGEIYNFAEQRKSLEQKGHQFHSSGDTEVLLKLYEEFGKDCVQHLRGMFAFAIYDRKKNELFLARDRLGMKPLKYFFNGKTFAFASELKALRTLKECPRAHDMEGVHHFLTMMYMPAPMTGFESMYKLPAAHTLTLNVKTGAYDIKRYWSLDFTPHESVSLDEWKERLWSLFEESVRLRMIADVPLGAFLSGGIDSASIVAAMSGASSSPVKTFSIGSREKSHNELPQAQLIADHFGTDHHPIVLDPDIVSLLPELVRMYEEPYGDPSAIPTYLVSRETRKDVTVALNGDGGDENFAGYVRYPIFLFSKRWQNMPAFIHRFADWATGAYHTSFGSTLSYRSKRFQHTINLPDEKRFLQYISFFTDAEKRALYNPKHKEVYPDTDSMYVEMTEASRERAQDDLHRVMSMDIDTYLADDLMPKVDIGSMSHGLEARSPFLDHVFMEHAAHVPARFKLRGNNKKKIWKDIMRDKLPSEILRKKKTGFRLPLDQWFRHELHDYVHDMIFRENTDMWRLLDRDAVEGFLQKYYKSHVDYSDHVWSLLWLSEWFSQYTDS